MNWEFKPIEYKKVDGIREPKNTFTKWQKFWIGLGKFVGKGLCGKWEFNFKIKF